MVRVTYTFPQSLGGGKVSLRELGVEEALRIAGAFRTDPLRRLDECAKRCVIELRGTPWTADNRDTAWAALTAKERDLILGAYGKLHVADAEEQEAFFASEELGVDS
jgi:hypothetical protein